MDRPASEDTVEHGATAREHDEEKADADATDMVKEEAIVKNGVRKMDDNADENLNLIGYVTNNPDFEEVDSSDGDVDEIVTSDSDEDEAEISDAGIDEPAMDDADINNDDMDELVTSDGGGCADGDVDEAIVSDSETEDDVDIDDVSSDGDIDEAVSLSTVAIDDEVVETSDVDNQRMVISLTQDVNSREADKDHQVRSFLLHDLGSHLALLDDT